jgi:hypothetical protein
VDAHSRLPLSASAAEISFSPVLNRARRANQLDLFLHIASLVPTQKRVTPRARTMQLCEALQGGYGVQDQAREIFLFLFVRIYCLLSAFRCRHKGRIAIVTNVVRNAVDGDGPSDARRNPRTAKSCGPGAPTLAPSLAFAPKAHAGRRWQTSIGSPRRARISRKPLRREGRLIPPVPVVFALAQIPFAREPRVHAVTRPSLRPLSDDEGHVLCKTRVLIASRENRVMSLRRYRGERSDQARSQARCLKSRSSSICGIAFRG